MTSKVEHVKAAKQTRSHTCHWPGCNLQVPPAMWGCKKHWFMLPRQLRSAIWTTYVAGQEETMTPSGEYLNAENAVQQWIAIKYPDKKEPPQTVTTNSGDSHAVERSIHDTLKKE